jgi:MFS family permease
VGRRGLFGAFVNSGSGWGLLLANLVFLGVATLPQEEFLSWGWRVPFLLSAVLIAVGVYVRLRLAESPEFARAENAILVGWAVIPARCTRRRPCSITTRNVEAAQEDGVSPRNGIAQGARRRSRGYLSISATAMRAADAQPAVNP